MKKILLFLVLASYSLVAQTPIWHYTFDGNSSPVNPSGGYGGSLTKVSGGTTSASNFGVDRFGNAQSSLIVKSDTNNDFTYYANLANLPQGSNPRSFSFWVRYKNAGDQNFFLYGDTASTGNMYGMSIGTSNSICYIKTAQNYTTQFVNTQFPHYISLNTADDDAWVHYTITSEATNTNVYKNGVLMANHSINLTTSGTTIKFGLSNLDNNNANSSLYFLLDDFKIYDQVLTETQIRQMYADAMAFDATDLVAYYGFENNLDCTNNSNYNLTAQDPANSYYNPGVIGQSREFTNNPVYNDVLGSAIDNGEFTIMVWEKINLLQSGTDYATVFELGSSLYARRRQSLFRTAYASNATTFVNEGTTILNPQATWVHHTVTVKNYGGSFNAIYYRNGELMSKTGNNSATTSIYTFVDRFVFGGGLDAAGNFLVSKNIKYVNLDEAYIYNRVLNQSEILATMYRTTLPAVLSNSNFELKEISLYPNPANSIFTVKVPNDTVKNITVIDLTGKTVLTATSQTVNISALQAGMYLVKVETISGKTGIEKIVRK
ncbi:T9SS type A sorting domain-containing protein [Flavobacterium sp. NRK F10]|uniref:LamG-like jellyroll fold domain-containing protein n=1 Tax=Flavobacterium sp. NRK F10 TaxID=2954931 RepID=UPI0020903AEB|nr:LamG-like jellyroll fold domain-containing protein [Flavobacterium sp. NRK F10]MCO6173678.1 T9SS type A sorting domain-containing protein [Flavobacterium sp. NRK F10]